jgi:hypothetical protein
MLLLDATLLIVLKLGSRARNEFEYLGQPRFIHLFDADAVAVAFFDGEKNDFACSIKAGLSYVSMFTKVSLFGLFFLDLVL